MSYRTGPDTSRRIIDVAVGVLVGLQGCSEGEAFDELVDVVKQTGVGIGTTAAALVALAGGHPSPQHTETCVAWGELLRRGGPVPSATAC